MCNGLVMIYMGPDGTDIDYMWGTLDGEEAEQNEIENTLCQQLGYDDGHVTLGSQSHKNDCGYEDSMGNKYVLSIMHAHHDRDCTTTHAADQCGSIAYIVQQFLITS